MEKQTKSDLILFAGVAIISVSIIASALIYAQAGAPVQEIKKANINDIQRRPAAPTSGGCSL